MRWARLRLGFAVEDEDITGSGVEKVGRPFTWNRSAAPAIQVRHTVAPKLSAAPWAFWLRIYAELSGSSHIALSSCPDTPRGRFRDEAVGR